MVDPIAPKQPHSTSVPLAEQDRFGNEERDAQQGNAESRQTGQDAEEQTDRASELDEWERPPKADREIIRQYVEIVDHGDRVVLDIRQFSNGGNKKRCGQD